MQQYENCSFVEMASKQAIVRMNELGKKGWRLKVVAGNVFYMEREITTPDKGRAGKQSVERGKTGGESTTPAGSAVASPASPPKNRSGVTNASKKSANTKNASAGKK
jgi:hypothetical protein